MMFVVVEPFICICVHVSFDLCWLADSFIKTIAVFILSSLTLLALAIGLFQKVVGIVLDIIAALLHIGVIVYYVLFIIKGAQYVNIMTNNNLIIQIVPPITLGVCAIACFICMFDCCRHVYISKFGSGAKGGSGESSTDYVPLQGSKHIDSDSDDSD